MTMGSDFLHSRLGRMGWPVFRLGLAATYRPGERVVRRALDGGVNYLFGFSIDTQMTRVVREMNADRREKVILGTISLDLFAVLLGGAVALLPVYAREILRVGATGLGALRSAPGVGAVIVAVVAAHWPIRRKAGVAMLSCVFLFGLLTIVFGLSRSFPLSLIALAVLGASDMVSVIVRHTLIQLSTPDEMRGRVSAVNMVFIGASNEVGQFESGITAQWFGTVPAVVLGGVGTMLVVVLWTVLFPRLRAVDELAKPRPAR